jgi:hypothetical protein
MKRPSGKEGTMTNSLLRRASVVVATAAALTGAVAKADVAASAELKQVGATAIVYQGPQVDVVLSYRFAKLNPGGGWLLLDTAMTAAEGPIEVPRGAFSVRTPTGEIVPLATQQALAKDYAVLAAPIARADFTREPMGYLIPRRTRHLRYFAERRPALVFPTEWLDEYHNSAGRLFFQIPGGVPRGAYELMIDLPGSHVSIPFTI